MNRRIYSGKNTPAFFRETLQFDVECPYKIRYKDFLNDDYAPPHYAQTLELGICRSVTGTLVAGNAHFDLLGDVVYVVPAEVVHSTAIKKGSGYIYVMHISLEHLQELLDIEKLIMQTKRIFLNTATILPIAESVHGIILEMIRQDDNPLVRTRLLLQIFEILCQHMPLRNDAGASFARKEHTPLHRIIGWTEEHYMEPIRLEQAAAAIGFTRTYFCTWFRLNTGLTYVQYLNLLRVNNACRLLVQTESISSACYNSGFQDMSYFIQVFKKLQGCTPKTYVRNYQKE